MPWREHRESNVLANCRLSCDLALLGTHLDLATVARVSLRAAALEAANVIDAFAGILTWIRFAFIILKVAQLAGKTWRGIENGFVSTKLACRPCERRNVNVQNKWNGNFSHTATLYTRRSTDRDRENLQAPSLSVSLRFFLLVDFATFPFYFHCARVRFMQIVFVPMK